MGYQREGNVDFLRAQGEAKGFSLQVIDLIARGKRRRDQQHGDPRGAAGGRSRAGARLAGSLLCADGRSRSRRSSRARTRLPDGEFEAVGRAGDPGERDLRGLGASGRRALHGGDQRRRAPAVRRRGRARRSLLARLRPEIYGQQLTFSFEKRLRPEVKFESLEELIVQINADVAETRGIPDAAGVGEWMMI